MSKHTSGGRIVDATGRPCPARVVGLDAGGTVVAATASDSNGRWNLAADVPMADIVASATAAGIATASAPARLDMELVLAPVFACRFRFEPVSDLAELWLDPLGLSGLPDRFLPALRSGVDRVVDLHVGTFDAATERLELGLQAGRYRLSGGRVALRESVDGHDDGLRVAQVLDRGKGRALDVERGDFVLEVGAAGEYVVSFRGSGR